MEKYDHQSIEKKWREIWEESGIYKTPTDATHENKMYILPQLPYPSGEGLHAGHAEVYTGCDIYARYERMNGKKVLEVIGWDAFGLPAENYAIKTNIHPRISTDKIIANFREQIKSLGISVDWDREVGSHNPDYYKWTQWFFLLMYKRGLAYRKKQAVNWCDHDKTVLANEQVIDGNCERCGSPVVQREMEQWFFKITEYAERLDKDLDKVDWPKESVKRQRDWIGVSHGAEIDFALQTNSEKLSEPLTVFTTAPVTLFGATFMVIAPEHALIEKQAGNITNLDAVHAYQEAASHKSELERQSQKEKTGVKIEGIEAVNPINGAKLPVYVADYVLNTYGTGAIVACPGHDDRDFEFAEKYSLPIIYLVKDAEFVNYSQKIKPNMGEFIAQNSGEFDGKTFAEMEEGILARLAETNTGRLKTQTRLRDWSVSRQRFWGAPIPMVYDPEGNIHPVDESDLPVYLPDDVDFTPTGQSPLTYSESFQGNVQEKYGPGWRREADTLDTFMCSSWYYYRYLDPHNDHAFASPEALKTWMPVDFYLGGPEHVNGHLLYSRFFTKVLFDAGYIDFDEPFLVHRHQGTIFGPDGRRMSKRWGNVINPTDVVKEHGGDTVRVYEMFMGPLEQDKSWNPEAASGIRKFLQRSYEINQEFKNQPKEGEIGLQINQLIKKVTDDLSELRYNTSIAEFMKLLNQLEAKELTLNRAEWEAYLLLLAPFAPFITEEMWHDLGNSESIHLQSWPKYDESTLQDLEVTVAVQVNGKMRDTIKIRTRASEEEVTKLAKQSEKVNNYLSQSEVLKVIYVPGKVINFILA